mgnify:CR=1 FL=1
MDRSKLHAVSLWRITMKSKFQEENMNTNVKEAINKMVENARKTGTIYCPGGREVTRGECYKCSQCKPSLWNFVDNYEV